MSAIVLNQPITESSPRVQGRTAGVFYLLTILVGIFGLMARGGLIVSGDAAATAGNILTHETLFRLSIAAGLIATACYIAVTQQLYEILKPVNRSLSMLAAFFSLVGCAIGGFSAVFLIAPLGILKGGEYLRVFDLEQLEALALLSVRVETQAENIGIVFFGMYCVLLGYLIYKSRFLPRVIGVLMAIAGLGWLTFLYPPLSSSLWPYIALPGLLGEGSLTVWLLVKGVDMSRRG